MSSSGCDLLSTHHCCYRSCSAGLLPCKRRAGSLMAIRSSSGHCHSLMFYIVIHRFSKLSFIDVLIPWHSVLPRCIPQGFKMQNRAIEGDEVAIRILAPSEWYQLASAKAAAEAEAAKTGAGGAAAGTPQAPAGAAAQVAPERSNAVPAALPSRAAAAAGAPPPTPLTAAVGAAPAAMTPPAWAGGQQRRPAGDLVASPALLLSGMCVCVCCHLGTVAGQARRLVASTLACGLCQPPQLPAVLPVA